MTGIGENTLAQPVKPPLRERRACLAKLVKNRLTLTAFLNLRRNDPDRERIFTFPFKGAMMKVMLAIPCIELILAIVATLVPFSAAEVGEKVPMIVIFIVLVLIGEVVRVVSAKGRETEYKGLTPELAAQRLAEEAEEN